MPGKKPPPRPSMLITTPVKVQLHPRCGRPILLGVAEGLWARCDPVVLTLPEQGLAVVMGIDLYGLTRVGLHHIDLLRAHHAHRWSIVPAHRCPHVWPPRSMPAVETSGTDEPRY